MFLCFHVLLFLFSYVFTFLHFYVLTFFRSYVISKYLSCNRLEKKFPRIKILANINSDNFHLKHFKWNIFSDTKGSSDQERNCDNDGIQESAEEAVDELHIQRRRTGFDTQPNHSFPRYRTGRNNIGGSCNHSVRHRCAEISCDVRIQRTARYYWNGASRSFRWRWIIIILTFNKPRN